MDIKVGNSIRADSSAWPSLTSDVSTYTATWTDGKSITTNADTAAVAYALRLHPNGQNLQRFEVRPGDQWVSDVGGDKERAEMSYEDYAFAESTAYWISYAMKYDFGEDREDTNTLFLTGQLHATKDAGDVQASPVFDCVLRSGVANTMDIRSRTSTVDPLVTSPNPTTHYSFTMPRREWVYFVHKYVWDPEGAGSIDSYVNGTQVVAYTGATGYRDVAGPYWKWGIYSGSASYNRIVYYANMEVTTTDLSSRVATPLTIYES